MAGCYRLILRLASGLRFVTKLSQFLSRFFVSGSGEPFGRGFFEGFGDAGELAIDLHGQGGIVVGRGVFKLGGEVSLAGFEAGDFRLQLGGALFLFALLAVEGGTGLGLGFALGPDFLESGAGRFRGLWSGCGLEVAKRSDRLGGLIGALPMVTLLALIWLHVEQQSQEKIANHAWYTFWYVLPTLPMFLVFPLLLPRVGFWVTLALCVVLTILCFGLFAILVRRFGIILL